MRRALVLALVIVAACGGKKGSSSGKVVRIAAAADLARAFEEIGPAFEKQTGIKVVVTPGSTGMLAKQIAEVAPFDLFAAANVSYVDEVVKAGACDGATKQLYARGRLVVWAKGDGAPKTFTDLADARFKKIGIANPDHAPYGTAAKQALVKAGIWDQVKDRMTLGENAQVPLQWAKTGDVDAAIVPLSLAVVADGGTSIPVDPALHEPLDQAMVVCGKGPGADAAKKFEAYIASDEGHEIMSRYGFLMPGEDAPAPKGGTGGDRAGSGSSAAAAPVARLDAKAVQAMIDGWIDAQNTDDVAKYEAFYAERFGGIKRVGARTWKFDRKGWLADRGRMFAAKAPMTVEADDVEITPVSAQMAVVRFTQTFAQAKFKDKGTKQLVVVEDKAGLKIASEEMLQSSLVDPRDDAPDAMLIVSDAQGSWLIVSDEIGETKGRPAHGGGGDGFDYSTHTKLVTGHPLVGKQVTLYPSGDTCTLGEISVMSMLTPHFGTIYEWEGDEDGDGNADSKPLTDAQIDREVADGGSQYVAADLSGCSAGDDVLGTFKPAKAWTPADDAANAALAEAAFVKLGEYKDIQEEFETDYAGKGDWTIDRDLPPDVGGGEPSIDTTGWTGPNGELLEVVSARVGAGCGDFSGSLIAVFKIVGGKAKLWGVSDTVPDAVIDLDADGVPELIDETDVSTFDGTSWGATTTLDVGYRDCPC